MVRLPLGKVYKQLSSCQGSLLVVIQAVYIAYEKDIDGQLSLFDVFNEAETFREPIQSEPPQESIIPEHKRRKAKKGSKFNDIPAEVVEYKLDESEQVCDNYHSPLTVMKKEIRKELVVVPAEVKVIEHVTHVYSCRNCDKNEGAAL